MNKSAYLTGLHTFGSGIVKEENAFGSVYKSVKVI